MAGRMLVIASLLMLSGGCADLPPDDTTSGETAIRSALDSVERDENGNWTCELGPMSPGNEAPPEIKAAASSPDAGQSDLACAGDGTCFACCHGGRKVVCCVICDGDIPMSCSAW